MLTWTMSSVITLPRTNFLLRSPFWRGRKPTPRLRTASTLTPPCTSGLMGVPSLSLPPVIWRLTLGRLAIDPSITSPILLPMRGWALGPSTSTAWHLPVLGSDMLSLNLANLIHSPQHGVNHTLGCPYLTFSCFLCSLISW